MIVGTKKKGNVCIKSRFFFYLKSNTNNQTIMINPIVKVIISSEKLWYALGKFAEAYIKKETKQTKNKSHHQEHHHHSAVVLTFFTTECDGTMKTGHSVRS